MAPEFFSFIGFAVLAVFALLALILGVVLAVWSRYKPALANPLRVLSVAALGSTLIAAVLLFLQGRHLVLAA